MQEKFPVTDSRYTSNISKIKKGSWKRKQFGDMSRGDGKENSLKTLKKGYAK